MVFQAIEFAARAHAGQFRKTSAIPYIHHPLSVAKTLIQYQCPTEVVVAAILHDTVEDTPVTLAEVRATFGDAVALLVEGASEPDKSACWEARKCHTIAHLEHASEELLLLTCADKLDNIRSIADDLVHQGEAVWDYFGRPKSYQRWYYFALLDVLRRRASGQALVSLVAVFGATVCGVFGDPPSDNELPTTYQEAAEKGWTP